ncbi:MAG: hypothetical protein A2W72_01490 [Burkholderiales bacterium RIFCSPLOWO2_12_67_14]|nr:MAG: hypothetical protein A3I64_07165 [Burkholderiales bacterium RIFCSPLOWO2_02_FULL_67_64]OGB40017.1 MAG: hypothetical protein A3E51_05450 [Burkholderiales bacterium RIFCSPHIGHO2_12_FULL_67_38]OGB46807.1 MAG: hypothetical protein A2W72_01490 [Burkholderiales bacterium RIFCSPLOWO2_12_67_14]
MNCCNEKGECRNGPGCAARSSAQPIVFAPGVIEVHRVGLLGSPAQRRELLRLAKASAWWLTWCGLAGLAAGLIVGAPL